MSQLVLIQKVALKTNYADSHSFPQTNKNHQSFRSHFQTVNFLSQIPVRLNANWQPSKEGEWQLVSRVEDQNGLELYETQIYLSVQKGEIGSPGMIAWLSSFGFLLPVLVLLLISALFSAVVFYSAWSKNK